MNNRSWRDEVWAKVRVKASKIRAIENNTGLKGFNLPDSWNASRYIVYSCNAKECPVVFRSDSLARVLEYIDHHETRVYKYKVYDRMLKSFDKDHFLRDMNRVQRKK